MKKLFLPFIDNGMGLSRTSWALSMFSLAISDALDGWEIVAQGISYPYPDGAMNIATTDFLESGSDRMLIIDTDEIFTPGAIKRLLSHDLPFVSGIYPKKKPGLEFPVIPLPENPSPFSDDQPVPVSVARCARGLLSLDRSVFEAMKPHVPSTVDPETGRQTWEFWQGLPGGHSEDYFLCDLWRSIGGTIWVDRFVQAKHEGSCVYPIEGTF